MTDVRSSAWPTRLVRISGIVGLCLISGIVGGALNRNFGTSNVTLSYADFVSIMLTAVSLLITVLAVFLAVAGFVGWTTIEQKVHSKAEDYLANGFKDDGRLMEMLNARLNSAAEGKTDEILAIIQERIVTETQYFSFLGVDPIDVDVEKDEPSTDSDGEGKDDESK